MCRVIRLFHLEPESLADRLLHPLRLPEGTMRAIWNARTLGFDPMRTI